MKIIIAAAFVAACSAPAFAAAPNRCVDDAAGIESAFAQVQQTVAAETVVEKAAAQAQTSAARAPVVAASAEDRRPGGHGRHHREGRRERRWGRYLCDELAYNVTAYDCSNLAGSEGWPVYALDGYVCLGCE
jgi:hypothetical protein